MREWLTVIIVLLIAGIVLDGVRRMRRARRESLRISRKARKLNPDDFPEVGSEICSGPRVVSYRDERDAESLTKSMRDSFAKSRLTVGAPNSRTPEQAALNLQEAVPMLMDSVEESGEQADAGAESAPVQRKRRDYTQPPSWAEPQPAGKSGRKSDPRNDVDEEASVPAWEADEPSLGSLDDFAELDAPEEVPEPKRAPAPKDSKPKRKGQRETPKAKHTAEAANEPAEVLVINLMAPAGERFEGEELLQALLDQGLRFGAMNIFHRHKFADGSGPVQFSLANMVVPGTFDLSTMSEFSTPGVSMFLSLPNDDESLAAFDSMAATAKALANTLGGELKDENRSVMTRQTLEHCRQRVLEFERKQRLMQHA
jgi:cell division protein ZipA